MKICTCTVGFRNLTLEETLAILDELGFEYFEGTTDAKVHIYPYVTGEKNTSELRDILSSFNVKMVAISGQSDFGVSDSHIDEQIKLVKKQIDLANHLTVPVIRIFASSIPSQYIDHKVIERTVKNLKKISSLAEQANVRLALENHYGITATADDIIHIIEGVGSDYIGVNFDPANFIPSGEDPVKAGKKLAPYIFHMHLKDCVPTSQGKYAGYDYVEVGSGIVDYKSILSDLKRNNYEGYLSLEYEDAKDPVLGTVKGRRNLRKLIENL
jgi:sugar phosphate isomerase/epimerase